MFYFINYRDNELEGTIDFSMLPSSITNLRLHNNNFQGNISNFGHLRNLYYWYMYSNNLNGTVDWSQFAQLTSMYSIQFQGNDINGDIDLSYVPFKNLEYLLYFAWQNNRFDGRINLGNMTSSFTRVDFSSNPDIKGGVDFSSIVSTSTAYPQIWLDTAVYCKTDIYCSHLSCIIPQPRTTNECSGKTACEGTCGECVACSTTSPSFVPTGFPITVFPSGIYTPTINPISTYPLTTPVPEPTINTYAFTSDTTINYNTVGADNTHSTEESAGQVTGGSSNSGSPNGSTNGLSNSHITLLIKGCIGAVLLIICAVGCAFCLTVYLKHKERMKSQEMTEMTRQTKVSTQPSVSVATFHQHHQVESGSVDQSNVNMNSQFKMPVQQHSMAAASAVRGHLQPGELDSNVNNNISDEQNKSNKSGKGSRKENDDDNDDGNVDIRYK